MSIGILIVLSVIAALLLGVVIVVIVEVSQAHARRSRGPAGGGDAERLRVTLRHEVDLTERAVTRAADEGLPVGELRQVVAEISSHAKRLEELLGSGAGVPAHLRDQHTKLTTVCAGIRTDLADAQARRAAIAVDDTLGRAQFEVEALRADRDVLNDPRIAEIRREIDGRPDIG